jgi:hypothetical protein
MCQNGRGYASWFARGGAQGDGHHGYFLLAACVYLHAEADEFRLIKQEQRIPPGPTAAFEFGTVPQRDTTVLLRVTARLHLARPSGSMYFLNLELNGREIRPARSRRVMRLVNRPLEAPVAANLPAPWFGNHAWRLLYAPDFEYRPGYCPNDPYTFVLDVTDLVNPAAENRLAITNTADKLHKSWTAPQAVPLDRIRGIRGPKGDRCRGRSWTIRSRLLAILLPNTTAFFDDLLHHRIAA